MTGWDGSQVGGCGNEGGFACEEVLATHWSRWQGLPVSLPGAVVYGATLLTLFAIGPRWTQHARRIAWSLLLILGVTMVGAACWFIGLQGLALQRFCPYCLGAHVGGLLAAALIFWHSPIGWRAQALAAPETLLIRPRTAGLLAALGLVAPGALVAGQLDPTAADLGVQVVPRAADNRDPPAKPPGDAPNPAAAATAAMARGQPLPRGVVVEVFDYTCAHCRRLHGDMKQAQKRYGERLSVVLYPMAMCQSCNRFVQTTAPGHEQACDYARLALAVKSLDALAFAQFNDWLMDPAEAPPLTAAHAYAAGLVGADVLDRAVASVPVEAELQNNVGLYGAMGQGKLPKLIAGQRIIVGAPRGAQLFQLLEEHAGLVPLSR